MTGTATKVDDLDREIMALLRSDGRMPYKTIAQRVNLSETAVRHRVQRLQKEGVLLISTVMIPYALGLVGASIRVRPQGGRIGEIADRIAELKEVDWVGITTGAYPIEVEIMVPGPDEIFASTERIEAIEGVASIEVSVHLRIVKYRLDF
jgi:Lrp/AsnC family transcriptional regulator, regulator for asnA, asnC and gidA